MKRELEKEKNATSLEEKGKLEIKDVQDLLTPSISNQALYRMYTGYKITVGSQPFSNQTQGQPIKYVNI